METVVIITIIFIVTALTFNSFFNLNNEEALNVSVGQVRSVLEEARSLTLASKSDQQYGVHFDTNAIVRFAGSVYDSNDPDNVIRELHQRVQILSTTLTGGGDDVIFDRLSGDTSESGTITISLVSDTSDTRVITVSQTGIVE